MGQPGLVLLALVLVPFLMVVLLRANGALVYLSLCLGAVLTQFLAADIEAFGKTFLPPNAGIAVSELKIGLLLAPALLTAILMLHTVRGLKHALNLIPALAVACLVPLLVVPLLPNDAQHSITSMSQWPQVIRAQDLIVGAGAFISLLFLWLQRRPKAKEADKKSA